MKQTESAAARARRERWERLEITVRCALCPDQPACLGQFVAATSRLAADGLMSDWAAHERCFSVLMGAAEDPALPLYWRWMCVDVACRPLARLTTLSRGDRKLRRRLVDHAGRLARADLSGPQPPAGAPA